MVKPQNGFLFRSPFVHGCILGGPDSDSGTRDQFADIEMSRFLTMSSDRFYRCSRRDESMRSGQGKMLCIVGNLVTSRANLSRHL